MQKVLQQKKTNCIRNEKLHLQKETALAKEKKKALQKKTAFAKKNYNKGVIFSRITNKTYGN